MEHGAGIDPVLGVGAFAKPPSQDVPPAVRGASGTGSGRNNSSLATFHPHEETSGLAAHFHKAYAEKVLAAIRDGKPLPALSEDPWSQNDMMTLAGILWGGVMSRGSYQLHEKGLALIDLERTHPERQEAVIVEFTREIAAVLKFLGTLTADIISGRYDADYGPEVKALFRTEAGEVVCQPVAGFR